MKALVSWEDETGSTHRWELVLNENDAEARHFLEALQLHVRFKLDALAPDALAPDSAAPDSAAPDSAAPDSATPD